MSEGESKTAARRLPRRRVAKGPSRPTYLKSGDVDRLMIMLVALTSELSAMRDRLDTHEAVAEADEKVTRANVEGYVLTPDRQADRESQRQAMLRRVFRVLTEESEAARF